MKKIYLAAVLSSLLSVNAAPCMAGSLAAGDEQCAQTNVVPDLGGDVTQVAGTNLARLQRAVDVLMQIPNVSVADDAIAVDGRGNAAIYIGHRRIVNLSELWILPASRIESVMVSKSPGAMYDQDVQAVIVVTLVSNMAEGLHVDNNLRFVLNTRPSVGDRLSLSYRYKNINLRTLVAYDQQRTHERKTQFEHNYQPDYTLLSRVKTTTRNNGHTQGLTARLGLDYDIASNQQLRFDYETYQTMLHKTRGNNARRLEYTVGPDGTLDLDHPTADLPQINRERTPQHYHNLIAEYQATLGGWQLFAGHNSLWQTINSYAETYRPVPVLNTDEDYLRRKLTMRNYLQAAAPVAQGTVQFGAEHSFYHTNVSLKNWVDDKQGRIHGVSDATALVAYVNAAQKIGALELDAGLRYEYIDYRYKALPDDENLQHSGYDSFKYHTSDGLWFPSAGLKVSLSKLSQIALRFTRTKHTPDATNIRVVVADGVTPYDFMLYVERVSTTSLDWRYDWLKLSATYNHYSDPLFNTTDGKVDFTGKCYDGLDMGVELTPTIGPWHPALSLHAHKQWLNMQLADGKSHANKPHYTVQFNNTLNLPANLMVRLNARYISRGYDRNVYYYKANFQLDASVMKDFCNKHLTIEAACQNILRQSRDDVTIFGSWKTLVSKGYRVRVPRVFTLSLRYRF